MPLYIVFAALPAIAACASGSAALYAWQRREVNGAAAFSLCMGSIFIWCFLTVFEYLSLDQTARIIFSKAEYIGIAFSPTLWLTFTLQYAHYDSWLARRGLIALNVIPALTLILAFTDYWHGWIWRSVSLTLQPFPQLVIEHGWWFNYVAIPYFYVLLTVGFGTLLTAAFVGSQLHRKQVFALLCGAMTPFICNVLYVVSGITFYGMDLTPVGFAMTGMIIQFSLFRTQFLDVAPISYRTVLLSAKDAVILLNVHHRIVDLNPSALAESTCWSSVEAVSGKRFERVFPCYGELLQGGSATDELTETISLPRRGAKGKDSLGEVFREVRVRSLLSPGGRLSGWVVIIRDVTLEKQQQAQLEQFAYLDSLTGLHNRRYLERKVEEVLSPYASHSELTLLPSLALLYIDLNRFKPINDTYGHEVGDAVLQHFAQCLRHSISTTDTAVRLSGDEFVALLYDADMSVAVAVRSRLLCSLAQEVTLSGHRLMLSASIGIACCPRDGVTLQDLLRQADGEMYREKRLRRDA